MTNAELARQMAAQHAKLRAWREKRNEANREIKSIWRTLDELSAKVKEKSK